MTILDGQADEIAMAFGRFSGVEQDPVINTSGFDTHLDLGPLQRPGRRICNVCVVSESRLINLDCFLAVSSTTSQRTLTLEAVVCIDALPDAAGI